MQIQNATDFVGLYVKALANGVDEILSSYRQKLLRIEEEVFCRSNAVDLCSQTSLFLYL